MCVGMQASIVRAAWSHKPPFPPCCLMSSSPKAPLRLLFQPQNLLEVPLPPVLQLFPEDLLKDPLDFSCSAGSTCT